MIPGIFISGTGTSVGKTVVTAGVARWFLARSAGCMVMKPVQTGAVPGKNGRLVAPDLDFVLRAAGLTVDDETFGYLAPYLFEPACSPHLAARLAGRPIEIEKILESVTWLAARHRPLIVESAGGLLAPLNETMSMADLARALGLPVLLVGHSGLGAINHVLLSLEALRRRRIKVLGVILNDVRPVPKADRFIHDDNVRAIESFGRVRILARIPYLGRRPDLKKLDESLADCNFE